jgi:coenzyme A diphosphatase NUDT7
MNIRQIEDRIKNQNRTKQAETESAAVLIPLMETGSGVEILFEKRALDLTSQPGEICFPGGKHEKGEDMSETAIRETAEELLIPKERIHLIGKIPPVVAPKGYLLYPFIGRLEQYDETYSRKEVDHVFTVPLNDLLGQRPQIYEATMITQPGEDFPYELIPDGKNYRWSVRNRRIHFYRSEGHIIWGITAYVLHCFLEMLQDESMV